jgi:hypothetical protein
MQPETCTCDVHTVDPSRDFYASGRIHVFIAMNLRDYVPSERRNDFDRLRGGEAFASALRGLVPSAGFVEDAQDRETTNRGHDFQVFRGHLAQDWLFPTYHLQKETVERPSHVPQDEWEKHEFHVRLSRAGFLEVRITHELPESGENFADILQSQLELAARGDVHENRRSLQIRLALYCANLFVQGLQEAVLVHEKVSNQHIALPFQRLGEQDDVPYRQRYMTMFLRRIVCQSCGRRIGADRLRTNYRATLAAILEGVLVEDATGRLTLPNMDEDILDVKDLASWGDDLCLFSPERALIYFPEKRIYLFGQTGTEAVPYERYWECIVRGIEHTVTLRAAMQIIEYYTTRYLDIVPALTKKVMDGFVTRGDKEDIGEMSQQVANTFNLLPRLRDVLVPTSSYRASYAIRKFEHLHAVLNIKDIEEHVERNVDELVSFAQFFTSTALDDDINKVGILIGFAALMIAGPSFLNDYQDFFIETYGWPAWTEWVVFGFILAFALILIVSALARLRKFFLSLFSSLLRRS